MSFTIPSFPLVVNIFRLGNRPPGTPDLVTVGNLTPGRRIAAQGAVFAAGTPWPDTFPFAWSYLLLPAGVDIRGQNSVSGHDWIEVPDGTGTYWAVGWVANVAQGFPNEHRMAYIFQAAPFIDPLP